MRILLSGLFAPFGFLFAPSSQPPPVSAHGSHGSHPNMIISGMHAADPGLPRSNVFADIEEKVGAISGAFEIRLLPESQANAGLAA